MGRDASAGRLINQNSVVKEHCTFALAPLCSCTTTEPASKSLSTRCNSQNSPPSKPSSVLLRSRLAFRRFSFIAFHKTFDRTMFIPCYLIALPSPSARQTQAVFSNQHLLFFVHSSSLLFLLETRLRRKAGNAQYHLSATRTPFHDDLLRYPATPIISNPYIFCFFMIQLLLLYLILV